MQDKAQKIIYSHTGIFSLPSMSHKSFYSLYQLLQTDLVIAKLISVAVVRIRMMRQYPSSYRH